MARPDTSVTTAHLLVVKPSGCVIALVVTDPPEPAISPYSTLVTRQSLAGFLTDPACQVPADIPIARLDLMPGDHGREFIVRAPMPAAHLPLGTVRPGGTVRPDLAYCGQRWETLGMFTEVSIDVYLSLVCQAGGTVCLASALTSTG